MSGNAYFTRSLADLVGSEYVRGVSEATAFCMGTDVEELVHLGNTQVAFWSEEDERRLHALLGAVGTSVCPGYARSSGGAGSAAFDAALKVGAAPLSGFGCVRIGEDGKAYFIGKSEHYHVSLGHRFPGFRLLDIARAVGVIHPEHNNTRGHITRLLEERLVATAAGIEVNDATALRRLRESGEPGVLNRVINLQTGSLAAEAALKMMLARFHRPDAHLPVPPYRGRRPVVLVMGDTSGGLGANYHGTTIIAQMMRGMWADLAREIRRALEIVPVPINDVRAFRSIVRRYDTGKRKVAGFFHEFVLMNYGAVRLDPDVLKVIYEICRRRDIPTAADEIQTGVWSPDGFMLRDYGVHPDIVVLGKGFPGGEYAASRVLFTSRLDNLEQFGALVTNGQEEIASLAYLIVLETIRENRRHIRLAGEYYHDQLRRIASDFPDIVERADGLRHLSSLFFHTDELADDFARRLNERGIEISTHSYKAESVPAAITKLPLIVTDAVIDFVVEAMRDVLAEMQETSA